jgi:transposase
MAKGLEQGGFRWPGIRDGVIRLTAAQMAVLLEGSYWCRILGGRKSMAPQLPG